MASYFDEIRRALLKATPEVRASVNTKITEAERAIRASLEARIHETDMVRKGWKGEQETSAALRAQVHQLEQELRAARELMAQTAMALLSQSGMAANDVKAA